MTFRERLEATIRTTLNEHHYEPDDEDLDCACGWFWGTEGEGDDLIDAIAKHQAEMVVARLDPQQAGWAYPCLDGSEQHFPWILGAVREERSKYEPVFRFGALTDG